MTMPRRSLWLALFVLAPIAIADVPDRAEMSAQGPSEAQLGTLLDGAFQGTFFYVDGQRGEGGFTIALSPDGPKRWKGSVRDLNGPQAKVAVAYDGLTFQMSKHYGPDRPADYSEWVYYVGVIKVDPVSGGAVVVGTWSIPGSPSDFGFFEIHLTD